MPDQKTPKFFIEPQQVFDGECQAHSDAQKKQAEGMADVAAQNLILKILAVKEKNSKRKAAATFSFTWSKRCQYGCSTEDMLTATVNEKVDTRGSSTEISRTGRQQTQTTQRMHREQQCEEAILAGNNQFEYDSGCPQRTWRMICSYLPLGECQEARFQTQFGRSLVKAK